MPADSRFSGLICEVQIVSTPQFFGFNLSIRSSQEQKGGAQRNQGLNSAAIAVLVGLGLLGVAPRALAHHAMSSSTPTNFFEGFLSGLAHPIIGLDHFVFIVAIGLLAAGQRRGALIPAGFIFTALLGTGIHLLKIELPIAEIIIASSAIALGILLWLQKRPTFKGLVTLVTCAGLFHGYAYGESIVGAQITPLFAYLLGFSVIQYIVALLALAIGKRVSQKVTPRSVPLLKLAGFAITSIGAFFLTSALIG